MQQPVASRIINVYDVALRHIVQPLLLVDMLLSVTGLSDFLFLVVLVPIPLPCGVALIYCCLCRFQGLFSVFIELHQIQVHVVIHEYIYHSSNMYSELHIVVFLECSI